MEILRFNKKGLKIPNLVIRVRIRVMVFNSTFNKISVISLVIRSCKSKKKTIQWAKIKRQSMIYNTLHRKLKIVQHEPPQKTQGNSDVPVIIYTHVYLEECLCKSISMTIVCTVVTLL